MKTVYRQDGSAVELSADDAAQWLRLGLATEAPAQVESPADVRRVKGQPTDEGVQA